MRAELKCVCCVHWESKRTSNVYGYVDLCFNPGNNLAFYDNQCITLKNGFGCPRKNTMTVRNNTVFCNGGRCNSCNGTARPFPSDDELNAMGAAAIAPFPLPAQALGVL